MAMSNDEKAKIYTNDEKALDQSYKSPINFLGKKRYLGRTNEFISKEIKFLLTDFAALEKCETRDEFKKAKDALVRNLKETFKKIIEPLEDEEIEQIGTGELKDILEIIEVRSMKRLGIPEDKIEQVLEKEKKAVEQQITRQIDGLDDLIEEGVQDFQKEKNKK